ncbi:hypothetical protein ABZP36_012590 [Zizania latifolia]
MNSSVAVSGGRGGGGLGLGGGGAGGGGGGPCGACKFLRRKCVQGCIFAPYFDSEHGSAQFAVVHKVFGASNVSKLLHQIPPHKRLDAVVTICYEAQARIRDPIYGCVSHIFSLQQQVVSLQAELTYLQAHLATMELPSPPPFSVEPAAQHQAPMAAANFSITDLPLSSNVPGTIDLSTLFDLPLPVQSQNQWELFDEQQLHQQHSFGPMGDGSSSSRGGGGGDGSDDGDLQALARELLDRQGRSSAGSKMDRPPHTM